MAVSRLQRQLCGEPHTRLATLPNQYASAISRRAASQRCHTRQSQQLSLLEVSATEDKQKREASAPRSQQSSVRRDSPDTSPTPPTELTAAIRACRSPAHLLDLYRRHGPEFTGLHAHATLNRLVDMTTSTSRGLEAYVNEATEQDGWRTQDTHSAPHHTHQLTGRLRVHQGQDFAQPPLHEKQDQDAERRESNYLASTSEPSLSSSTRGGGAQSQQQRLLVSQRGKHCVASEAPDPEQQQRQQQQQQQDECMPRLTRRPPQPAGPGSVGDSSNGQADATSPPPKRLVVSMVTGLVAILSRACPKLDGRGVAETARAMSRLRYQDPSLLGRLEQRSRKLMKEVSRTYGGQGSQGRRGSRRQQRHSGADGDSSSSSGSSDSMDNGLPVRADGIAAAPRARNKEQQAAGAGMHADDIYTMIVAFGAMGHRPSAAWRVAVLKAMEPHITSYAASPRGRLPLLISYLGTFGAAPQPGWLRSACTAMRPRLAACPPAQLRALLAGLAAMQHNPGDAWMEEYLAASEGQLGDYSPWELVSTVVSLASLRCSPGEAWLERFYACTAALVGTTGGLTGRLAAVMLSSLSQLKCKPAGDWLTLLLLGTRRSLGDASAEELTDMLTALARLRFRPPEPWLQQYFTASFQRLPFQTPEQCCATAVALSMLGRRPQALWLEELARHMGSKLALMPAGQQTSAMVAMVELGYVPSAVWLEAYEKQSNAKLAENNAEELCRALAALAKVGFRPQASWLYAFMMAAYSKLDSFDSAQLAQIFDCLPTLTPHGSWLDEIIQICASETAMRVVQPQTSQQNVEALELEQQQQLQMHPQAMPQQELSSLNPPSAFSTEVAEAVVVTLFESAQASTTSSVSAMSASAAATELSSSEALVLGQASVGLNAVEEASLSAIPMVVSNAPAERNVNDQAMQESQTRDGLSLFAGNGEDSAPAHLNATIPISRELIPAVGSVLAVAAPCAQRLNGAATGMGLGLLGDGSVRELVADFSGSDGAVISTDAVPTQQIPELVDTGVAATTALAAAIVTGRSAQGRSNDGSKVTGKGSGLRITSRGRERGDGPGGGGDGGASGGRGGGNWDEDLFADMVDSNSADTSNDSVGGGGSGGRTPDIGLLQRPRVARAPAAAVLASSSPTTPLCAPSALLSAPIAIEPAAVAELAAAQPTVAMAVSQGEPCLGPDLGLGPEAHTAAILNRAEKALLRPKPRPPSPTTQTSMSGSTTAARAPLILVPTAMEDAASAMAGGMDSSAACGSKPLRPFSSAGPAIMEGTVTASPSPPPPLSCSSLARGTAEAPPASSSITTIATAASAITVDNVCVQYLDSASLSRLMGSSDGPPGPDFSSCQKRARGSRAGHSRGSTGPFQLGRIWTNEGKGADGNGGTPIGGPVPSPLG